MLRAPFRGITNLPSVPEIPFKTESAKSTSSTTSRDEIKNNSRTVRTTNTKTLMQARRVSIAAWPPQSTMQFHHPRRRASIASVRPEPHLLSTMKPVNNSTVRTLVSQPKRRVSIATSHPESHFLSTVSPHNTSNFQSSSGIVMPELRSTPVGEVTPVTGRGSPPMQVGSWKPKHPTVVALHKRHFLWSTGE